MIIFFALIFVMGLCILENTEHWLSKHYKKSDFVGLAYFWGISLNAFEGSSQVLEVYNKMEFKKRDFFKALSFGICIVTLLY